MNNECLYCKDNPKNHSFFCQYYDEKIYKFKTYISRAMLYDHPKSIIHHIEHDYYFCKSSKQCKPWIWIIDFENASFEHYTAFNTIIELSKWIYKYKYLTTIIIKNTNKLLMYPLISLSKLFLPNHIEILII